MKSAEAEKSGYGSGCVAITGSVIATMKGSDSGHTRDPQVCRKLLSSCTVYYGASYMGGSVE